MSHRKVSDYKRQFMELYNQGLNDIEIGETLGFHSTTIGQYRRKLGLPSRVRRTRFVRDFSEEEKEKIMKMHSNGISVKKIAVEFDISYPTMLKECNEMGIDTSLGFRMWAHRENEVIKIWEYLENYGPQPVKKLVNELDISDQRMDEYIKNLPDILESFMFFKDIRKGVLSPLYDAIYFNLSYSQNGAFISLIDDPRLIDYIVDNTNFKMVTPYEESFLRKYFETHIGSDRTNKLCKLARLKAEGDKTAKDELASDRKRFEIINQRKLEEEKTRLEETTHLFKLYMELNEAGYPNQEIKNIMSVHKKNIAPPPNSEITETTPTYNRKTPACTIKLEKEGIYKFLKPYQVEVMKYVWNHPDGIISVEAHGYLKTLSNKKLHKSRASVIFFLDDMTEGGFLVKEWHIGKGGKRGVWSPSPDVPCEEAYMLKMAMLMIKVAKKIINATSPIIRVES